jgi:hypothetical protein
MLAGVAKVFGENLTQRQYIHHKFPNKLQIKLLLTVHPLQLIFSHAKLQLSASETFCRIFLFLIPFHLQSVQIHSAN